MTVIRRDGIESPFSNWIRGEQQLDSIQERLSVLDTDYWVHQFRARRDRVGERMIDSIMCLELKTNQADLPFAQRDTLRLIAALHRKVAYTENGRIKTVKLDMVGEIRFVRMYGYFLLRLERDRPDDGGWIEWHGRRVDLQTLIEILSFRRDPRTHRKRSDRRHHTASTGQKHPDLFKIV